MKSILFFFLLTGYTAVAQNEHRITRIEFSSLTRGHQESIVFSVDSVKIMVNSKTGAKPLKKKDWGQLLNSLKSVVLPDIDGLKSPTMKRAHDGARHSAITIVTQSKTYSHGFDDENPHDKLKPLMKVIHALKSKTALK